MRHDTDFLRAIEQSRCALGAVTQAGLLEKSRPWQGFGGGFRRFGRFALVYLLGGHGRFQDDPGIDQAVSAGDVITIFPDVGHRYGPRPDQTWREMFIVFDGPVFDQWYAAGLIDPARPIHNARPVDVWRRRFEHVTESRGSDQADALLEVCRVQHLLADLLGGPSGVSHDDHESAWARDAAELIDQSIPGRIDWSRLARQLHVSSATLRRRFGHHFGASPARYRNRRIIEAACRMMQQTDLTDQQIANRLGFCDPYYFSRCFKQYIGQSPRQYRRSLP